MTDAPRFEVPTSAPTVPDSPGFEAPAATPPSASAVRARAVAAARAQPAVVADADEVAYAGFVTRALAFAIDAGVINVVAIAVAAVAALASTIVFIPSDVKTVLVAIGAAAWVVWSVAYFAAFWATTGVTLGNRVMKIRVRRASGNAKLGYRRALQRFAGLILAVIPLMVGLLPILMTERRRGLQDHLGDTVVVYDR